jgi:hypothetical protein
MYKISHHFRLCAGHEEKYAKIWVPKDLARKYGRQRSRIAIRLALVTGSNVLLATRVYNTFLKIISF